MEYHFVTKQQFDADALNNKYVRAALFIHAVCFLAVLTQTVSSPAPLNPPTYRFIEHGEYKENQYGTSIEAIRSVQAKNKMCVVDVQPEVGREGVRRWGWGVEEGSCHSR